ncbi:MAG: hypothetical protein EXX96DRAFT_608258 [Benjaminiella poitrasii]|nr:MAG: hypothetical protein EXX96DRAFT_608258 [Benjaminiella poitrasii]
MIKTAPEIDVMTVDLPYGTKILETEQKPVIQLSVLQQQGRHTMENAAAETSIAYETRALVENIRPRNTIYAYLPKQAKYTQRCTEKHDENNILSLIFIINKEQRIKTPWSLNHPRGPVLESFKSSLKHLCSVARQSEDFVNPGINSIQDGYDGEQLSPITICKKKKKWREKLSETGGKTNQEHQKLYSGVISYKNVQTCAFGAVGFYLFHRFHVKGEAFPDFSTNQNWFKIKLTRGRQADKSVSYNTQLTSVNNAFAAVGIVVIQLLPYKCAYI